MHSNDDGDGDIGWDRESPGERTPPEYDHDRGCPKCGSQRTETGTVQTAGGNLSMMSDVATNEFRVVSCSMCGYSEFYRERGDDDIVDLFFE
ncbi:zinc ribbon domain-containing protein [Haloarcula salinisoli]|uniref:Zinc ribbon domain-containing protein n=1 Tax=Haloarcula salinisoli TaxID=2487746 RepID=A0A8J8C8V9_9EURY|nr:zinc ribbon domain-containing protein [Halomicroarcula salinisoli]MBX0287798.1 zinc ribbon domain-containing protein [Halomicroarcula salinisoli]MBX0304722.1 zinc ribbon domain-containing protein [Halomicroarcula salinisoli]